MVIQYIYRNSINKQIFTKFIYRNKFTKYLKYKQHNIKTNIYKYI